MTFGHLLRSIAALCVAFAALDGASSANRTAPVDRPFAYRPAVPGYQYVFPRDHFEHEDFRTEWWYYTGNLKGPHGERYGFELVFFREGERHPAGSQSAWDIQDLYLAHAALTDAAGKTFQYRERVNRAGPGVAGASFEKRRVWNGNWSARWDGENQTLDAVTDRFGFHLQLKPEKPFVIHGEGGVSQKAEGRGHASYYVSFPLLAVSGKIAIGGKEVPVNGRAWMDHEWFTSQLATDEVGWDWFSVQLDDGTELMLFELRRKDGSISPFSSGTFVDKGGHATHLPMASFSLQPLALWHKYPVQWRIRVSSLNIDLTCRAILPDQELRGENGNPSYWEGAVDYLGTKKGVGYLEMTGYDRPVKLE